MRKIFILLLFVLLIFAVKSYAYDYEIPVCITFNGEYVDFDDEPKLIDGTTYLPVRFFCEALDASVSWNNKTNTVSIKSGENNIVFSIGSSTAFINDNPVKINGEAMIINGKTYLPVRFIVESFGGKVSWENHFYRVSIVMQNIDFPNDKIEIKNYGDDEIYWLAKIISSESEDEPIKGKVAVGNVVLNRVYSDKYPDTIYSVIFDKKHGYQFQPVQNGAINKQPVQEAYLAAKLCLEGENVVGNCLYFLNPDIATSNWIPQNKNYFTTIGNHDFYY